MRLTRVQGTEGTKYVSLHTKQRAVIVRLEERKANNMLPSTMREYSCKRKLQRHRCRKLSVLLIRLHPTEALLLDLGAYTSYRLVNLDAMLFHYANRDRRLYSGTFLLRLDFPQSLPRSHAAATHVALYTTWTSTKSIARR